MNWWLFDRRCDLARWLSRLSDVVLQSSRSRRWVCVESERTIDEASLNVLLLTCVRRISNGHGAEAATVCSRSGRVIAAAIHVVDDEAFVALHSMILTEMRKSAATIRKEQP